MKFYFNSAHIFRKKNEVQVNLEPSTYLVLVILTPPYHSVLQGGWQAILLEEMVTSLPLILMNSKTFQIFYISFRVC
jgi:hypothetical protein